MLVDAASPVQSPLLEWAECKEYGQKSERSSYSFSF